MQYLYYSSHTLIGFDRKYVSAGTTLKNSDNEGLCSLTNSSLSGSCGSPYFTLTGLKTNTYFGVHLSGREKDGTRWNTVYTTKHPLVKRLYVDYIIPQFEKVRGAVPSELTWLQK